MHSIALDRMTSRVQRVDKIVTLFMNRSSTNLERNLQEKIFRALRK